MSRRCRTDSPVQQQESLRLAQGRRKGRRMLARGYTYAPGFSAVAIAYTGHSTASYLADAISKNVYDPFAHHFASIVSPLFLETYRQVDPVTRTKMEEMLLTLTAEIPRLLSKWTSISPSTPTVRKRSNPHLY
ncbi:hypothetical protein BV25DRAFT_1922764 [Artomyces pyxidatus]|uniref:Uncharacterized protein n=1 Tax=Artomyces pyxidatus TaxID=48021 RepID=A0ACB8SCY0_9AGAM|nr:hypothetical protein BV25DRAFT_1922764 [Artomyces pyxidatus]